jgi:putative tricarboxylic transport membrane protein
MVDALFQAFLSLMQPMHMLFLCTGVVMGLVLGFLPGLGGLAGLTLLLPFLFGMDPMLALPLMVGMMAVTPTSDTFPAVLMGIPGSAGSAATIVDGFPLAKQGEGARALGAAFSASLIGGLFGALVLTLMVFVARPLILAIGFGEQLILMVLALTMVGTLAGSNAFKGLAACGVGLLLGGIGAAPGTGEYRFDFGLLYLIDGLPLIVLALALFAVPEILEIARSRVTISSTPELGSGWMKGFFETLRHKWLVLRCCTIGTLLGVLPGVGGSIIDWIVYGHAVQSARDRSMFGKGDIRGVIGPESANNAKEAGVLIPTVMFGIPGSGSMAVFLAALMLIGVEPGINMIERNLDLTYTIMWSLAIANVIGTATCLLLAKPVSRLTVVRYSLVAPFLVVIIYFAAFQATQSWYDLGAIFVLGVLGMYMKRFGWSRPALLIGFVLSGQLEASLYQSIEVYGAKFLERTGVQVLIALMLVSIALMAAFRTRRPPPDIKGLHAPSHLLPQGIFIAVLMAWPLYTLWEAFHRFTYLAKIFPMVVGVITLLFLGAIVVVYATRRRPSYMFYDSELAWDEGRRPMRSDIYYQCMLLAFLAIIALFGFLIAVFVSITLWLMMKASVAWWRAALAASAAVMVFTILGYGVGLEFAPGILQSLVEMPWPFD